MEEKPRMNFQRFQSSKIKRKYILKFGLYIVVLVSLWIWYLNVSANSTQRQSDVTVEHEELELNNIVIEP